MAETRISTDDNRIRRRLESSTCEGRYLLDVPGTGINMPFQEDVFCRLQRFGANISTSTSMLSLETQMRGRGSEYNRTYRDAPNKGPVNLLPTSNQLKDGFQNMNYATQMPFTDQSRATLPAFIVRNQEQMPRWEEFLGERNPQFHVDKNFQSNFGTRMGQKDLYLAQLSDNKRKSTHTDIQSTE